MNEPRVRRALVSVSDKQGLLELVRGLVAAGVEIYSTGGTRAFLLAEGLEVHEVSAYTGFPEILDGRVKTLHPRVHAGILCRHDRADDLAVLAEHDIVPFELVVVNLYPFAATIARDDVTPAEAIEQIDIGGPSLIRAAAKNHAFVAVVTSPAQYARVGAQVAADGATRYELRRELAAAAFEHTARYDRTIADWFAGQRAEGPFPATLNLALTRREVLRYGENPHQAGALYTDVAPGGGHLATARQLHGKELSYNNLLDLDSALAIARSLGDSAAVVVKHNNPCGAASGRDQADVLRRALDGDAQSAFGGVLGFNRPLEPAAALVLAEPDRFIEAIVAPGFTAEALEILTTRPKWRANVRLVDVGRLENAAGNSELRGTGGDARGTGGSDLRRIDSFDLRRIDGGVLVQDRDLEPDPQPEWRIVTRRHPSDAEVADLAFAWAVVRHVKSNAIVLASEATLRGVGAGQMSRVDSVEIAVRKAGPHASGSALASDAFFPFPDSIEQAAAAGVRAVIQPGGSRKDDEVVAAADQHELAMIFTGRRHFRH